MRLPLETTIRYDPPASSGSACTTGATEPPGWPGPLPGRRWMPVPASYNDLVVASGEREHVGDVWYQRDVVVPAAWRGRRIVLRSTVS